MSNVSDYWPSESAWRYDVMQKLVLSCELIEDWDRTFFDTTQVLSDTYRSLHEERTAGRPNERELDEIFYKLQRSSTVIDSVVGSACVVLMRWMEQVKQIAIDSFILLETKFPFDTDAETYKQKWRRHSGMIMKNFGSRVPGSPISGALATWQVGNVFKHSGGSELHSPTLQVAEQLGFRSHALKASENVGDDTLRQIALREVGYTLGEDSIERMALKLGCSRALGLMPLYDHVDSWQNAIGSKLRDEHAVLQSGQGDQGRN